MTARATQNGARNGVVTTNGTIYLAHYYNNASLLRTKRGNV